jgi:hypothetical protein
MNPVDLRRHDSSQTLAIASFTLSLALHAGVVVALSHADFFTPSTDARRDRVATEALLVLPPALATPPPPTPPPEQPTQPAKPPEPPKPSEPATEATVRPGIDESNATTPNWLGFNEATPHAGERSTIEQSALSPAPGNPAPDGPSRPSLEPAAAPSQPGTPQAPAPAAASPPAPEPATPAPSTRPTPDDRAKAPGGEGDGRKPAPEPVATPATTPRETPQEAASQPVAATSRPTPDTTPETQPREGLQETSPAGIEPKAQPPAPAQTPPPPPGSGPARLEPQSPLTPPPQPATQPSVQPAVQPAAPLGTPPPPTTDTRGKAPGLASDAESVAAAIRDAIDVKPGKVLAAKGLRIQTVRPEWAVTTRLMARPTNPVVRVTFGRGGRVIKADFVDGQGTGWSDVDGPLKDALYRWTARGAALDQIPPTPGPGGEPRGVSLSFRVILSNDDTPLQR